MSFCLRLAERWSELGFTNLMYCTLPEVYYVEILIAMYWATGHLNANMSSLFLLGATWSAYLSDANYQPP